jgi:hypothetical protein
MPSLRLSELTRWKMVKYSFFQLIMLYISGQVKTGTILYEGSFIIIKGDQNGKQK